MKQLVMATHVKKAPGYLYFLSSRGDIMRVKMSRKKGRKMAKELVLKVGLKRELGFLYYISAKGDIMRAPMKGGAKKFKVHRK
jgi:hypothetical protein